MKLVYIKIKKQSQNCDKYILSCVALEVEPFAQARSDGVTIKWSTPRINTGCDGSVIARYTINYTPVGSRDENPRVDVDPDQSVMVNIDGLVKSTEYRYFVVSVDRNGRNVRSLSNVFTTIDDCECLSLCCIICAVHVMSLVYRITCLGAWTFISSKYPI